MKHAIFFILSILTPAFAFAQLSSISLVGSEYDGSPEYWEKQHYIADNVELPFYFNVPYVSFGATDPEVLANQQTPESKPLVIYDYRDVETHDGHSHEGGLESDTEIGLRLFVVDGEDGRKRNSQRLAESGLFKDGDIVLSFRREWYKSLRYSHVQLGISHAGIVYHEEEEDGVTYLKNLDMPLNDHTAGDEGYLNSAHYQKARLLHVIRPTGMSDGQREVVGKWLRLVDQNARSQYGPGKKLVFNKNYAVPNYREGVELKYVADLARIALGAPGDQVNMFCSEFVWALLSLRNCDPEATRSAFLAGQTPTCINPIFDPLPPTGTYLTAKDKSREDLTIGLADGIPLIAQTMYGRSSSSDAINENVDTLINRKAFSEHGDATNISSGHRAVEAQLIERQPDFFNQLETYFKKSNNTDQQDLMWVAGFQEKFNQGMLSNYSPTSFLVHGLLPEGTPIKRMDYVGTIYYTDKSDINYAPDMGPPVNPYSLFLDRAFEALH